MTGAILLAARWTRGVRRADLELCYLPRRERGRQPLTTQAVRARRDGVARVPSVPNCSRTSASACDAQSKLTTPAPGPSHPIELVQEGTLGSPAMLYEMVELARVGDPASTQPAK